MKYRIAPDFWSPAKRATESIVSYVTGCAMQWAGKKTSKVVFHFSEIA